MHNECMHENPRINRQDRQKITFHGSAYPKEIPNSALPLHTQKQCTARGSSWGSSIPVSDHYRFLDPPWGEGRQTSRQLADASTPTIHQIIDQKHSLGLKYFSADVRCLGCYIGGPRCVSKHQRPTFLGKVKGCLLNSAGDGSESTVLYKAKNAKDTNTVQNTTGV